ncbi:MAG: LPS export ABC transporter ATP-binding protein [Candidatus Neomarinimicrobiota bacterium]|jgi:lipopolysaccharide export system ATP-binding protein|nr:LPS export ABC transporter ATP-binding protein [Candidatus Neomarinimicrobiota bacterium]MDD3965491.1 LPS export ABC transporter ATP-binding protein [Candidatus Neomarinimicrobiota bacterium]MDX9780158.1 LPS export ABC transporter ATP-binding protein [bacterium]
MAVLRAEKLVKIYGRRKVVNDIDLEAKSGEIVGLLGPNGAGKTTSFYMITGMVRPHSGHIYLDGKDITGLPMYKRAQMGIGYLTQESSVFRKLSVEDNLRLVLEVYLKDRKEIQRRIDQLIDEFKLETVRKNKGAALSGGERRRTEIARALATDPKFILLDEPFAGIDPIAVEDIQEMVVRLKDRGIGVIITDHNVHETLSITDHSYLLYQGMVLKAGTGDFLANDPEARRLYLGAKFRLDR